MRRRLDEHLGGLDKRVGPRPDLGWIRTIREALGMSTIELAARLGVTYARVQQIERAEIRGTIPLPTLERIAAALGCRVCYFLAPNEPLEGMVRRQAFEQTLRGFAATTTTTTTTTRRPLPQKAGDEADRDGNRDRDRARRAIRDDDEEVIAWVEALAYDRIDRRGLWTVPLQPPTQPPTPTERP
ncbi:MAG TPA: helix-turn-helix domain-containing protein [Acidimicrobiales bacterium]